MSSSRSGKEPEIGRATLICGWLFGILSLISVSLCFWARRQHMQHCGEHNPLGVDNYLLVVATIVSFALLVQITWAVVDEGQGQHIRDESPTEITMVIKVYFLLPIPTQLIVA